MDVLVLGGGDSTERDVSLRSAANVATALKAAGYTVRTADPRDGLEVLDTLPPKTIVFPILHGAGGEDGVIQAELEKRGIAYLGTNSVQSAICFDKWLTRQVLETHGLPIAKGAIVTSDTYWQHELAGSPHVLKIATGGSSIGTLIVRDPTTISDAKVIEVFGLGTYAVLEELVEGTEITVPVLDQTALPVIEIAPPSGAEFDYENKYNGKTAELCPPQSVSEALQKQAQDLAVTVHNALAARHLSRTDIIIKDDSSMVVLELNTMPGMTEQSLFPKSAVVAGISMPDLMKRFVELAKGDAHE